MTKKWWQLDATKIETHTEPNISKTSKRHHAMHEQAPCFFFFLINTKIDFHIYKPMINTNLIQFVTMPNLNT